jgi:hypothetical protein
VSVWVSTKTWRAQMFFSFARLCLKLLLALLDYCDGRKKRVFRPPPPPVRRWFFMYAYPSIQVPFGNMELGGAVKERERKRGPSLPSLPAPPKVVVCDFGLLLRRSLQQPLPPSSPRPRRPRLLLWTLFRYLISASCSPSLSTLSWNQL